MNKSTLIKISFTFVTVATVISASLPQKALARETGTVPIVATGTVPIVRALGNASISRVRDNGTTPIIATPSTTTVTASPSPSPYDSYFTVTVTVNEAPTVDTPLTLTTDHSEAIGLPSTLIVPAGSTSATVTVSVNAGSQRHHKNVHIFATANNTTVETEVAVHYTNEED